VGNLKEIQGPDDKANEILNQVKEQLHEKLGKAKEFAPILISYRKQLVAGTNYFLKVQTTTENFIHVRVFVDLQGKSELIGFELSHTVSDEILYF